MRSAETPPTSPLDPTNFGKTENGLYGRKTAKKMGEVRVATKYPATYPNLEEAHNDDYGLFPIKKLSTDFPKKQLTSPSSMPYNIYVVVNSF